MFVVPKRNIETWFAHLLGETVNESDKYRKYACENDCRHQVIGNCFFNSLQGKGESVIDRLFIVFMCAILDP
jgi:hypothetical protein